MNTVKRTRRKRKAPSANKWDPKYAVDAYAMARDGMSLHGVGKALGITALTVRRWYKQHELFRYAFDKGKAYSKKTPTEWIEEYVVGRIPDSSKEYWNELCEINKTKDSDKAIEALMRRCGPNFRKLAFLHAFATSGFSMTLACRQVNVNKPLVEQWCRSDARFANLFAGVKDAMGDFYETALVQAVASGEPSAIVFANKTYNRKRGYNEKVEVEVGGSVQHSHIHAHVDLDSLDLDIETRRKLVAAIKAKAATEDDSKDVEAQFIPESPKLLTSAGN